MKLENSPSTYVRYVTAMELQTISKPEKIITIIRLKN